MKNYQLSLSILSVDFSCLGAQIQEAEEGADCFHLDVMDGVFVPNITFGPDLVKKIRTLTKKTLDIHLMIIDPDRYLANFAAAGSDVISVHVETCPHLHRTLSTIKNLGCMAGVAINPATPLSMIEEVLPMVDQIILMSVNPGFGGQRFIQESFIKLEKLMTILKKKQIFPKVEIDGGVNQENAGKLVQLGANRLVVGSSVFNKNPIGENIKNIHASIS